MSEQTDTQAMAALLADWFRLRDWAANLLSTKLGLGDPREILQSTNRGNTSIPGTDWRYRTHGIGVEVYQEGGRSVDFDFDTDGFKTPDSWRLRWFAEGEVKAQRPLANSYRALLSHIDQFDTLAEEVISANGKTRG